MLLPLLLCKLPLSLFALQVPPTQVRQKKEDSSHEHPSHYE
jgi:hypothetical protein